MKYLVLVLSIFISMVLTGCNNIPSSGVYVTNNVKDTKMVIDSTRGGVLNPNITTGDTAFVPITGFPPGHQFVVSAKVYRPSDGAYLGMTEYHDSIWFDAANHFGRTWVITNYTSITPSYPSSNPNPGPRPLGRLQIMCNLKDVKVKVSSSEDDKVYGPLEVGGSISVPIGVKPETRNFTLVAKVYSKTDEYLGYDDFSDQIDQDRGYGTDRIWTIRGYSLVRSLATR